MPSPRTATTTPRITTFVIGMLCVSGCGDGSSTDASDTDLADGANDRWAEELSCGESAVYIHVEETGEECLPGPTIHRGVSETCEVMGASFEAFADSPRHVAWINLGADGAWYTGETFTTDFVFRTFENRLYDASSACEFRVTRTGARGGDWVEAELVAPCNAEPGDVPPVMPPLPTLTIQAFAFRAPILDYHPSELPAACEYLLDE